MIGSKFVHQYKVAQHTPHWCGPAGESLMQALADALCFDGGDPLKPYGAAPYFPPARDAKAIAAAVRAGSFRGMRLAGASTGWVLVWEVSLASALGSLGLASSSYAELSHTLANLVESGDSATAPEMHMVRGMGRTRFVRMRVPKW